MDEELIPGEDGPGWLNHENAALRAEVGRLRAALSRAEKGGRDVSGAETPAEQMHRINDELEASRAALAASEGRYRAIVESALDYAIITTDPAGCVTGWSPGASRILGWSEDEMLGRDGRLIWTLEDRQAGVPELEMQAALVNGTAPDERWHLKRDGARFWALGQLTPLRCGMSRGFLKILRDRTAQRVAEESLRESEERLRLIVEGARDYAIFALNHQGEVTSWNSGAARILGWAEADILGRSAAVLYTPEDVAAGEPETEMDAALKEGHVDGGRWMRRRDGTRFWAGQTLTQLRDEAGRGRGFLKVLRDRTEQRLAEESLRESEARFRHMADSAPALIWMTDATGRVTFANMRHDFMFGRPAADIVREGLWSAVVVPEDRERHAAEFMAAFKDRTPYRTVSRVRDKDGQVRWLRCEGVPRLDDAGRFLGYTGCSVDITEARLAAEDLEQRVAARTAELSHALGQLHGEVLEREQAEEALRQAQKMEAIGQLTGGIAHDFNNMLQGIAGSLDLMDRRIAQGRPEEVGRLVAAARQAANRAAGLTHRLLAFARRQTLMPTAVEPDRLIRGMEELIRRTMGPVVQVELLLRDGVWSVLSDANQLENVLLNLCINARDAMPDGGRLTIATADRHLARTDLTGQDDVPPGDYVEISVTDTGTGMTPDVLARAFEPFFTTKPLGQGTGLGLSQLYGFVRQSGGALWLSSQPGQGTAVRLCLPRHAAPGVNSNEAAGTVSAPSKAELPGAEAIERRVLVVEDEEGVRALLVEVLRDLGCVVLEAADGSAALQALQSGAQVDLLVTDVGLPGLNGRQFADAARKSRPNLPVLLITGYAGTALDSGQLARGMEIMTKPFTVDALAARVRALLKVAHA